MLRDLIGSVGWCHGVLPDNETKSPSRDHSRCWRSSPLARTDTTELERGYTGQRGQDEQNRRARKAAVQTPGKALTQQTLDTTGGGIQ